MASASMNDIKARMKSVESTMQITKAMELVLETDIRIKTSYDSPERLLEVLVLQLSQEARHA